MQIHTHMGPKRGKSLRLPISEMGSEKEYFRPERRLDALVMFTVSHAITSLVRSLVSATTVVAAKCCQKVC
jgi:hypothetical protein